MKQQSEDKAGARAAEEGAGGGQPLLKGPPINDVRIRGGEGADIVREI